jgi:hypothetical protein
MQESLIPRAVVSVKTFLQMETGCLSGVETWQKETAADGAGYELPHSPLPHSRWSHYWSLWDLLLCMYSLWAHHPPTSSLHWPSFLSLPLPVVKGWASGITTHPTYHPTVPDHARHETGVPSLSQCKEESEEWPYPMRREMQEILRGLFLGSYSSAMRSNLPILQKHEITH